MSEWFASTAEEPLSRQEVLTEVLCELPPKPTQHAGAPGSTISTTVLGERFHDDDLRTFPPLCTGEDVPSRRRRWHGLRSAAARVEDAFEAFGRDRDRDDFCRLWVDFLAPRSPQRLLGSHPAVTLTQPVAGAQSAAAPHWTSPLGPSSRGAIPTLMLSTNGASMADRLDLYGTFASYLREQQGAYVALLRPEDLAAGVGSCFSSALAQLGGLPESAAEDVLGLVAWYEHETGYGWNQAPTAVVANAEPSQIMNEAGKSAITTTPVKGAPKTSGRGGGGGGAKTPGGRGGKGRTPGGRGAPDINGPGGRGGEEAGDGGTVAARLRARRGQQDQAAAAAAEAEARSAREALAALHARNRQRHVVLLVEAADRVADRGPLRALLAALHGESHRLPVVLVLGLSSPAALYSSKLPVDVASRLQLMAAELAPHPLQLHRLFQDVLTAPQASPPLLLDGATMRELLIQSQLLEPSLACLRTALLEANEQHFRREPLAPLALLPLQQRQADEAAAAAVARRRTLQERQKRHSDPAGGEETDSISSDDGEDERDDNLPVCYVSANSKKGDDDHNKDDETVAIEDGPEGLAALDESWLERRRRRHCARLEAAISELPLELLRTACASLSASIAKENSGAGGRCNDPASQRARAVSKAVTEAFSALSAWRLGLRWLAVLAERSGAIQMPGGRRYTLPSLYVAAGSPHFWKPPASAVAAAIAASAAAAGGHRTAARAGPGAGASTTSVVAVAAASIGESLLAGVLGATTGTPAAGSGASCRSSGNGRGTLRALPEEELGLVLDDLMDAARESLLHDWLPAPAVMRAAKDLAELCLSCGQNGAGKGEQHGMAKHDQHQQHRHLGVGGPSGVATAAKGGVDMGVGLGADVDDEMSPVRRRLAAQGLTSPATAEKLRRITERFGLLDPHPAPKCLQPNNAQQPLPPQQPRRPASGPAAALPPSSSIKLPPTGQTQSQRQRQQALHAAVQQRAVAGPSAVAAVAAAAAEAGGRQAGSATASFAERAAELLAAALRELLGTCPFHLPGSAVFTFRDSRELRRRLVGAPAMALHLALTQPEVFLKDLTPGLHPGQEDAAIAYQLLVGCREGTDLRDWLADFCAASGLGRMQEVQQHGAGGKEEEEEVGGSAGADGDGPMGRSRTSRRRQAPRKRTAAPKQEMVLALDDQQAEVAVDALACRFEQVARELEAVGLCRFSKRRKGMYVHRTYFPPEAIA